MATTGTFKAPSSNYMKEYEAKDFNNIKSMIVLQDQLKDIVHTAALKTIIDMANNNITTQLEVDYHSDIEVTAYEIKGHINPVYKYKEALRVATTDIIDKYINELYPGGGEKIQNT